MPPFASKRGRTVLTEVKITDIHSTALVGERVQLGADVRIGPGVIVSDDAVIGDRTTIDAYSFIGPATEIGPDNRIGMSVHVGGDPQITGWEAVASRCRLGAGNTLREFVTIHRAKDADGETIVGDGCTLMVASHVAHDCRVGNNVVLVNGVLLAGHVEVGDNAFVSGNCVVHQFVRIGRRVMVRGLTALTKDVVPFTLVDETNTVRGLNKVGLQRAGLPKSTIGQLDWAYREIFRSSRPVSHSVLLIEKERPCDEVREMTNFIRASTRGICLWTPPHARRREPLEAETGSDLVIGDD